MTFVLETGIMRPRNTPEGSAVCVDTERTKQQEKEPTEHTKVLWELSKLFWGVLL